MFLKNRNIRSKIKRSKVTDYAALKSHVRAQLSCIEFKSVCQKVASVACMMKITLNGSLLSDENRYIGNSLTSVACA